MVISEMIKAANFKIISCEEYLWKCFGENARFMDFASGPLEASVSCVFDTKTENVYTVEISTINQKVYRWIDPDYLEALKAEVEARNLPFNIAYDNVEFYDLCCVDDVFSKTKQVIETGDCDDKITINLDINEDVLLQLQEYCKNNNVAIEVFWEDF